MVAPIGATCCYVAPFRYSALSMAKPSHAERLARARELAGRLHLLPDDERELWGLAASPISQTELAAHRGIDRTTLWRQLRRIETKLEGREAPRRHCVCGCQRELPATATRRRRYLTGTCRQRGQRRYLKLLERHGERTAAVMTGRPVPAPASARS